MNYCNLKGVSFDRLIEMKIYFLIVKLMVSFEGQGSESLKHFRKPKLDFDSFRCAHIAPTFLKT